MHPPPVLGPFRQSRNGLPFPQSGYLPVSLPGKTFDIHSKRIEVGTNLVEGLGCGVTVGYVDRIETPLLGQNRGVVSVLEPDRRVVIGPGDTCASRFDRFPYGELRTEIVQIGGVFFRKIVGDMPVLATGAMKIASPGPRRENGRAGMKMVERFLLDRVGADSGRGSVNQTVEFSLPIQSGFTETAVTFLEDTPDLTDVAADFS